MQTFLPYKSFERSARCLDRRRLGKQRVEAMQILNTLLGRGTGWASHPAVRMWRGHEGALHDYLSAMRTEWARRGYRNDKVDEFLLSLRGERLEYAPPPWLGDRRLHASHRGNLLRKDPEWYGRFGWKEGPEEGYVWPVTQEGA